MKLPNMNPFLLSFWKSIAEKRGVDKYVLTEVAAFFYIIFLTFFILRVGYGYTNANDQDKCIVRSYGDVILSPFYALGCQLGKDRFIYRLN